MPDIITESRTQADPAALHDRLVARLRAHGALAIAVSGGIDSMTLAYIAHRCSGVKIRMVNAVSPAVPREATARLVEPWLGADLAGLGQSGVGLPIPTLIDVRVDPADPPRDGILTALVGAVSPDIRVDDHRVWVDQLLG